MNQVQKCIVDRAGCAAVNVCELRGFTWKNPQALSCVNFCLTVLHLGLTNKTFQIDFNKTFARVILRESSPHRQFVFMISVEVQISTIRHLSASRNRRGYQTTLPCQTPKHSAPVRFQGRGTFCKSSRCRTDSVWRKIKNLSIPVGVRSLPISLKHPEESPIPISSVWDQVRICFLFESACHVQRRRVTKKHCPLKSIEY